MTELKTAPMPKGPALKSNLRVAFYVYPTAFQNPGGGEIQLLKTKEYLERLGVSVKLLDPWKDKLSQFDLLHVFGSVKDCLPMMQAAKAQNVKMVLSTICWYSWKSAWGTYGTPSQRALAVLRHAAKLLFPFIPSQRRQMITLSERLCPNSQSEADQLTRFFGADSSKIRPVPNGVDEYFKNSKPDAFIAKYNLKDFILCVGRIEPRKNQLNMIRALKGIQQPVVFIGKFVSHYKDYYDACRKEADSNMHFLDFFEHGSELLPSAYAACNTFLLASWLETPGLAALEAGLAGAKVVITDQGATKEYFQSYASYAAPDNLADIRRKVLEAHAAPKSDDLKNHILKNYLWEAVAAKTLEVYNEVAKIHG